MASKSGKENKKGKGELAEVLAELATLRRDLEALQAKEEARTSSPVASPVPLLSSTAEQVARRAGAFTPIQRARLIEALRRDGPQTPPQLGARVGLATGSLYHHLRELVAAGIALVEEKTYRLTPEGIRLAEAFFAPPPTSRETDPQA